MRKISGENSFLSKCLIRSIYLGMWSEKKHSLPIKIIGKLIYKFVDVTFCKLLLNCDISPKVIIGDGIIIYHPFGIFINGSTVIGDNFICRGQITIGNKGIEIGDDSSPTIGNNVNVGVGARLIGPITIGDNCLVGANAVVTKSFPKDSTLVGIPAKSLS